MNQFPSIDHVLYSVLIGIFLPVKTKIMIILQIHEYGFFYAPKGTSGGILKSHRPSMRLSVRLSVRPSVTNRVSAIIS